MMRTMKLAMAFLVFAAATAGQVQAGLLFDGETIGYEYLFPDASTTAFNPDPVVVGAGVELPGLFNSSFDVASMDISDTNILVDYYAANSWSPAAFNGFRIFDLGATLPAITSVTVNAATNMAGFSAANITFDADNIYVNWQGLGFDPSTIVSLDVNVSAVPEPSSCALLGLGGIGWVIRGYRRRRASVA